MGQVSDALHSLSSAQKPTRGVSLYSRYVNRPAGRVLAALSFAAGLTPNQVTAVSAVFTCAGITMIAVLPPAWPMAVGVMACLLLGFAFDSADGQLARLRRASSRAGEWLDHVVDSAKLVALHAAVLVSFYRYVDLPAEAYLLIPLGYLLVSVVQFVGGLLADQLRRLSEASGGVGESHRPVASLRAVILLPGDYGVLCIALLSLATPSVFVAVYSALFALNAALMVGLLAKWFRELRSTATIEQGPESGRFGQGP